MSAFFAEASKMVRAPCCDKMGLKKGPWTPEEDRILVSYIKTYGHGNWRALPKQAGLLRCGKSCRLRWINYLRPDIKRGNFSTEEENTIIELHQTLGNRWSVIASHLPGRTDNEIKNFWNTHLKKRLPECLEREHVKKRRERDLEKHVILGLASDLSRSFHQDGRAADFLVSEEKPGVPASKASESASLSSFGPAGVSSSPSPSFNIESEASLKFVSSSSSRFTIDPAASFCVNSSSNTVSDIEAGSEVTRFFEGTLSSLPKFDSLDFLSAEATPREEFETSQSKEEKNSRFYIEGDNGGFQDLLRSESEGRDFWLEVLREVNLSNALTTVNSGDMDFYC